MNRFDYVRAGSVAEALAEAATPGAVFLAGGTNLLDLMKGGDFQAGTLGRHLTPARPGCDRTCRRRVGAHRCAGAQQRSGA